MRGAGRMVLRVDEAPTAEMNACWACAADVLSLMVYDKSDDSLALHVDFNSKGNV